MKKFLAVICALALGAGCMLFAACGGGSTAGSGEFLGLEEGEEFVTDEEIALTFTRPTGNDAQEAWWSETIAAFNEEYEGRISVSETTVPRGNSREYEQKISIWAGVRFPPRRAVRGRPVHLQLRKFRRAHPHRQLYL